MKSEIDAISPFVDELMLKIRETHCDPGAEFAIELALREALANAVLHGNHEDSGKRFTFAASAMQHQAFHSSFATRARASIQKGCQTRWLWKISTPSMDAAFS